MERDNILVRASGIAGPLSFNVAPQSALLLGRQPDTGKLPAALRNELGGSKIQCETVPSARVSGNHVLLWHTGDALRVWDLGSRNGSWVQLRSQQRIEVSGTLTLSLDLARSGEAGQLEQLPRNSEWQSEREFADAVAQSVRDWLRTLNLRAEVSVSFMPQDHSEGRFALANGAELCVLPLRDVTHKFLWSTVLDKIRIFINEQNNTFELLQGHDEGFVLASPALREAHRQIADAAARGMHVLLLGPTGVGKGRLATCYHRHSRQRSGPFATIRCALLSQEQLYAQLFGAKKGAFIGCTADITGAVEAAHEGTLFIDEIDDMSSEVQRALLRFLDLRGEYQRLGDTRTRRANVQIVCATNADLDDPIHRVERFREDLWYRLAVRVVRVPPLRERREDTAAYLQACVLRSGVSAYQALTPGALQQVLDDPWPGNFRDLHNFVERLPAAACASSIGEILCTAALQEGRHGARPAPPTPGPAAAPEREPEPEPTREAPTRADWPKIAAQAAAAFAKDHGLAPGQWGQIPIFMEKYLQPVFLAQACGLGQIDEIGKDLNFAELARRMNLADGTTVKLQLQRYLERFRPPGGAED